MTDYAALAAQLALPVYAGMADAAIVTAINAATVVQAMDVPGATVRAMLLTSGDWGRIKALSLPGATVAAALLVVVINFVDTCEAGLTFETSKPAVLADVQAGLTAFVAAGLISAATQTALLALTTTLVSQATLMGFSAVAVSDLAAARNVA